jgi:S-adenosylmethionine:diacylglycerol 3-amino-3-carboxypropyl transferase
MTRPAYANLIDTDVVHVVGSYEDARALNADADCVRWVAATERHHAWDWAAGKTLAFHGRTHSQHPWDALRAGAKRVFFVDLDGELQEWVREE